MYDSQALLRVSTDPRALTVLAGVIIAATLGHWTSEKLAKARDDSQVNLRHVPMPASTLPLLGNLVDVVQHAHVYHDWVLQYCRAFQFAPWKYRMALNKEVIVLAFPEAIEDVMVRHFSDFPKGERQNYLTEPIFSDGVLGSDGEKWLHQRKIAAKFFTAKTLRVLMSRSVQKGLLEVQQVLAKHQASGEEVD
ncbi:hypothetical protein Poli38472_008241 [Pythium oligandrum]|uniref:Cytochrome P450 n=1 Tax=Pythium oligandrum TaxID=41045 RepID=A0A8K1CM50_PYTOL|nr:hypothetical protein Poli38472_008241 [Pythium oligandrum]|eukprot:TMW65599.1 hypothetical protein Poli38472_008241 [Pythium oligandrum]